MQCKPTSNNLVPDINSNLTFSIDESKRDSQNIPKRFIKETLDVKELLQNNNAKVYAYVLTTVKHDEVKHKFVQKGCSPNFEGGIGTLCCCKHHMRTYPDIVKDTWIAGFTGSSKKYGYKNGLYYLAKIEETHSSFSELRKYLGQKISNNKDASEHKLGDIYFLKNNKKDPNDINNYHIPCKDHVHWKNGKSKSMEYDIEYSPKKLLVFNRANTFVWENPIFHSKSFIGRGSRKFETIDNFMENLK